MDQNQQYHQNCTWYQFLYNNGQHYYQFLYNNGQYYFRDRQPVEEEEAPLAMGVAYNQPRVQAQIGAPTYNYNNSWSLTPFERIMGLGYNQPRVQAQISAPTYNDNCWSLTPFERMGLGYNQPTDQAQIGAPTYNENCWSLTPFERMVLRFASLSVFEHDYSLWGTCDYDEVLRIDDDAWVISSSLFESGSIANKGDEKEEEEIDQVCEPEEEEEAEEEEEEEEEDVLTVEFLDKIAARKAKANGICNT